MRQEGGRVRPPEVVMVVVRDQTERAVEFSMPRPREAVRVDGNNASRLERKAGPKRDHHLRRRAQMCDRASPPTVPFNEARAHQSLLEMLTRVCDVVVLLGDRQPKVLLPAGTTLSPADIAHPRFAPSSLKP